jgi:hypothetical protein
MTRRLPSVPRHPRAVAVLAASVSASLGLGAAPAAADPVLDANCPGPSNGTLGVSDTDPRIAQTFTAQSTGSLTRGEIEIVKAGPGNDWGMQILATDGLGNPTNSVLASTTIADSTVPNGNQPIAGEFAAPASVEAGQQYAISIAHPPDVQVRIRSPDPCPGKPFESFSQSGPWFSVDPVLGPEYDVVFAVYVEPPPPPKAGRTLTLDANKDKVKEGKKVRLSGQLNQVVRQGECESGQPVQLQRKRPSKTTFTTVEQLQTDAAGSFFAKKKVKKTFEYRAQVAETATCANGTSNTEKVKVKKTK